jgi:8-oxo-dGTP pyrophosphatase MutT (NUDIX family)
VNRPDLYKPVGRWFAQRWFRLTRSLTLGARVVAINADGAICLIRHTYTPGWHLPGGGVEKGETALAAAIKEAREEAGLVIAPQDLALFSIHDNSRVFPGDHVLIYHTRHWQPVAVDNALEIAGCDFFKPDALPEGTTPGTRRRIAEAFGAPVAENW